MKYYIDMPSLDLVGSQNIPHYAHGALGPNKA